MHKDFPSGLVCYFVKRIDFARREPLVLGGGANLQMIPHVDGWVDLYPIGRADSLCSAYSMPFSTARVVNIEYYIYAMAGEYSVRNGFTHEFKPKRYCRFNWYEDCGNLTSRGYKLFSLFPVEQVIDHVNLGTGFKVMQFND